MPDDRACRGASLALRKALIAHDGSRGAEKALHVAIDIAIRLQTELHQITVQERLPRHVENIGGRTGIGRVLSTEQELTDYARSVSEKSCTVAWAKGIKLIPHAAYGEAVEEITKIVRGQGFSLLIVGYNGHSAIFGYNWGSTSQQLIRLSPCPVLVAK